jgi:excisionase family DNA binding protein
MSVDDVAERLGLHPRTVRGYIRGGRLHATRIGKQYRVTPADFAALTAPERGLEYESHTVGAQDETSVSTLVVDSTAVVQVDGLTKPIADRLLTHLSATAYGAGVRTDLAVTAPANRLKIVVSGNLAATIAFLTEVDRTIEALGAET